MSAPSVVVAAGGTGGHIYPGLATADAIRRIAPDARITFVGTPRGLEQRLIPARGYDLRLVDMVPWRGARHATAFAFAVGRATVQARKVLKEVEADVVVGMGGYPSLPPVIAARTSKVPSVIHASGAIAGRALLIAARLTPNVALSFASAGSAFPRHTVRVVGMPLSPELAGFDRAALRAAARREVAVADGVTLVLVSGGSQGSVRLNDLAVGLATRWRDRDDVQLLVKVGAGHAEAVDDALRASGGARIATAVAYLDSMPAAYAAADFAICRGGAATVAELATCGLPSLLVPYPYAPVLEEQTANANVLVHVGAAIACADADATADHVAALLETLFLDRSRLETMAAAASGAGHAGAAEALARWALDLAAGAPR